MGYYAAHEKYLGTISKTVTITYPKSESGGSKTVTVEEPIYIDVYVESDPFERSVDRCDNSFQLLKTGIAAAEAAEVRSRYDSSRQVGKSLDDGFFQVVNANITMQAKEESANAKALFGTLMVQKQELDKIKERMEGDYNLIKSRYIKLFEDYNKEMHTRIYSLNKQTFKLVEESREEMMRPVDSMLTAASLVGQKENLALQTKITASRVKLFASHVIRKVKDYIEGQNLLKFSLKDILSPRTDAAAYCLPVMYVQTSEGQNCRNSLFTPAALAGQEETLARHLASDSLTWEAMNPETYRQVTDALSARVTAQYAGSEHSRRIGDTIMALWQKSAPLAL